MSITLFERFPALSPLPLAGIATLPTPLEPFDPGLPDVRARLASLSVKRDDHTSARYGGNKVRKLDFLLGRALADGRRAVVTYGAYGSNHCLATAVHSRALGIEPHVVLSPQEVGPFAPATLLAHVALGTILHVVEGWDGTALGTEVAAELEARDGIAPMVIPMGGTNGVSTLGHVNAALEALAQGPAPDVVYVPGGTQGTALGLAIGFAAAGAPTRVESIRVTPAEVGGREQIERIAAEAFDILKSLDLEFPPLALDDLDFVLREDWFEPGYGVVTPETSAAVAAAAHDRVKLETTYSGKALAALVADARSGRLDGRKVLFWDTYNSAPLPAPGSIEALPEVLQAYVRECWKAFPEVAPVQERDRP